MIEVEYVTITVSSLIFQRLAERTAFRLIAEISGNRRLPKLALSLPHTVPRGGRARPSERLDVLTNENVWTHPCLDFFTSEDVWTHASQPRFRVSATAECDESPNPFPTGRKFDQKIFTFFPTGRKFAKILLDNRRSSIIRFLCDERRVHKS